MNETSFLLRNKTGLIAVLGTVVVVALILIVANFNIKISSKKDQAAVVQPTQQPQTNDHHGGGGAAVDTTIFDSLTNKAAPDFTLESYDGKKIILSELKGKNVLLFFNEGLMCYPSCWNQIAAFGKDTKLAEKAVILNITVDPKNEWKQAINKMPELEKATVLFDSLREVSQKYGVLTLPSSMHKGQFPGHSYVLIDKEGIVKFARDDVAMAVRNNELAVELDKI